jgi:hypothetical protein
MAPRMLSKTRLSCETGNPPSPLCFEDNNVILSPYHWNNLFYRLFKPKDSQCNDNRQMYDLCWLWYDWYMSDNLLYFLEAERELLSVGEWLDDLTWSPSQCYYFLQHQGVDYILYLHWRWKDPWQAYVIRNVASLDAMNQDPAVWSGNVFEMYEVRYSAKELDLAKERIVSLFFEFNGQFPELRDLLQQTS